MKNIIKQIEKIKGVVTVEKAGENMAVVVFEPKKPDMFWWNMDFGLGESTTTFWKVPNKEDIPEPIFTTEDGVNLYNREDCCVWVSIDDFRYGNQPFIHEAMSGHTNLKYFSKEAAALKWIEENKPKKSLSPDELVDGRIYVDEGRSMQVFRFKKCIVGNANNRTFIAIYSHLYVGGNFCYGDICIDPSNKTCRPATPSEAQSLIRAEIEHGYFHELKDAK